MKNSELLLNIEDIQLQLQQTLLETNKKYYFIGISGGIDSCLALKMLIDSVGVDKIKAYYLPIEFNNSQNEINIIEQEFNIKIETIDLTECWKNLNQSFNIKSHENLINQKSKLRSMFLYAKAFEENGLVVSCLNYDEYYVGYFTKFGDSNGDVYPLINLLKSEIYEMANYLDLPKVIINKKPSADLFVDQTDEADLGFSYQDLDNYLMFETINQTIENKIEALKNRNAHKHSLSKFIDITKKVRKI